MLIKITFGGNWKCKGPNGELQGEPETDRPESRVHTGQAEQVTQGGTERHGAAVAGPAAGLQVCRRGQARRRLMPLQQTSWGAI